MIKIILLIVFIILLIIFVKCRFWNTRQIKNLFNELNIVVSGKKGTGKDTLCSFVSYGKEHNCNIPYHSNTNLITLNELNIPDLTRQNLTNKVKLNLDYSGYKKFENITFISDSQLYYPSYDDSALKREYPYLANTYALYRQLFDAPLHFNTQNLDRLWKILREQIEDTIKCLWVKYTPLYIFLKVRYYENVKDNMDNLKPLKRKLFGNIDITIENSKRGLIKEYLLIIPRWKVQHDSYYFKKIVFKEDTIK